MSVTSAAASVDWQLIASGAGILIASIWATYQGLKKGKEKVERADSSSLTTVLGGTLMDNISMRDLTDALKENTQAVREQTHQLERHNDVMILIGRVPKPD